MIGRARGPRRWLAAAVLVVVAVLATVLLAAGGGSSELPGNRIPGHRLTIYTSLPLDGPSAPVAQAVLGGERAALAATHGRVGDLHIRLVALDDATVARGGWDPGQTTAAAQTALTDRTTIGYVGDLESGASAVSVPLLNHAGIPQISPTSTAVGLTTPGPGASPGEPAKYYPTGVRTFVALPPDDAAQAAAQVRVQRRLGCTRVDVLNDESFDGFDAAASFGLVAHALGLAVVGSQSFDPKAADYTSLANSLAAGAPDCVVLSAMPGAPTTLLAREVASALPHARLFATATLAAPAFTDPTAGGVPGAVAARMFVTVPAWPPNQPRGAAWAGLRAPFGLYGYEAVRMLLAAIARATDHGHGTARRSSVRKALLSVRDTGGPLGAVTVRGDGTTTLGGWRVMAIAGGALVPWDGQAPPLG